MTAPVADPADILAVYLRRPDVHPYGIADVVQLWDRSRWWRDDAAVVGLMDLPGSPVPVLYAVAADAPGRTLDLLDRLAPQLPGAFVATGPRGMAATLGTSGYAATFRRDYVKMHLAAAAALPPADPRVRVLHPDDLADLEALFDTDPVAGDFFHAGLLDTELYLGLHVDGELRAAGGIHVIEPLHGVAAIGNVTTHPEHRRQGLGVAVVATLCHALLNRVPTVGLNVREANVPARALYERLGFRTVLPYEETELARR